MYNEDSELSKKLQMIARSNPSQRGPNNEIYVGERFEVELTGFEKLERAANMINCTLIWIKDSCFMVAKPKEEGE